jgi:GAF domain-containing protein
VTRAIASEAARLDAVAQPVAYTDEALEDVIALAIETFDVPIAIVSLTERDQQVAIATYGAARVSAARDNACTHAIASGGTMIVADATADTRFDANPFVLNAPRVRFYAVAGKRRTMRARSRCFYRRVFARAHRRNTGANVVSFDKARKGSQ